MMDKMYGPPSIYTTSLQRDLLNGYIGKSVKANNGTEGVSVSRGTFILYMMSCGNFSPESCAITIQKFAKKIEKSKCPLGGHIDGTQPGVA